MGRRLISGLERSRCPLYGPFIVGGKLEAGSLRHVAVGLWDLGQW